jgi:hypothetical protein
MQRRTVDQLEALLAESFERYPAWTDTPVVEYRLRANLREDIREAKHRELKPITHFGTSPVGIV